MPNIFEKTASRLSKIIAHREYIPTEHFIFEDKGLIYTSIPKVACTSIKIGLMAQSLQDSNSPDEYMNVHRITSRFMSYSIANKYQNYYKFAFVRNPLDRLVSCYKDKVKTEMQHNGRYHFATNYNTVIKLLTGKKFTHDMSFDDFVKLVARIPDYLSDGHFKSQYSMLYKRGKQIPDYIGRFESLSTDWNHLAKKYDLKVLGEMNRTEKTDWQAYYKNKEILELAANRYKNDIDKFGYESDYRALLKKSGDDFH